jgi:glycosyltransferase involved in cell wall biosynthesis
MKFRRRKLLFLYTEAAQYTLACLEALAVEHDAEVHLLRWPVNNEAPFSFESTHVRMHVRDRGNDRALEAMVAALEPDLIVTSGWVDKGYLRICRRQRRRGIPIAMINDTAWRGDLRQWLAVALARFWIRRTFSHAWVTGTPQARYARRLGFPEARIRKGFYSADTSRFLAMGERLMEHRTQQWPHRFLCVARYIPTKGHQVLCDAFAALADAGEAGDWELWIAGTGELHEQVSNSPSGRHPRIRHLGFKQPQEMEAVLEQCGVFVLPSTFEPWGVVVHEHACAGFPLLLSSAVGAAERFLVDMENGNRFIAGDPNTLRTMLRMMVLSSDAELRAMGQRSMELGRSWTPSHWASTAHTLLHQ